MEDAESERDFHGPGEDLTGSCRDPCDLGNCRSAAQEVGIAGEHDAEHSDGKGGGEAVVLVVAGSKSSVEEPHVEVEEGRRS